MKIAIFGLGYVGAVTAACLSRRGHQVVGVDVQAQKVEDLNLGRSPIIEPGVPELIRDARAAGRLRATTDTSEAVSAADVSLVCVGTPSRVSGGPELGYVRQVTRELAETLACHHAPHALVYRSTLLPGSTRRLTEEWLAPLQRRGSLEVFYYPEFLREGSAVSDFNEPSLAVVGTVDGSALPAALADLFGPAVPAVTWETAELLKYACNAFHATKVAFANEIGRLARHSGVDAQTVMELLCRDTRLNISSYYLRPGNPFGGSCLPKDVRALAQFARLNGLNLPVVENLLPSNDRHLQSLLELVAASGHREVIILGLSFKAHTDDLRESAMVEVAQHCLGRGYEVRIFDPQLNLSALIGSNKRMIDTRMPHLAGLLHADLRTALGKRGLIVATQPCAPIDELARCVTVEHTVLDINGWPELRHLPARYTGLCW